MCECRNIAYIFFIFFYFFYFEKGQLYKGMHIENVTQLVMKSHPYIMLPTVTQIREKLSDISGMISRFIGHWRRNFLKVRHATSSRGEIRISRRITAFVK